MSPAAMAPRAPFCAWHVTGPRRTCAKTVRGLLQRGRQSYRRSHGPPTPLPGRRCVLPRNDTRQQQGPHRSGRRRPRRLRPHPQARRAPLRVAYSRALPDGQPLPPGRRDAHPEPLRRHARPQRRLRACLQRTARPPRPRVRTPLLVEADRVRGAVHGHPRIRPQQPAPPRLRPPLRPMALDVGPSGPSDRFVSCRTTRTS